MIDVRLIVEFISENIETIVDLPLLRNQEFTVKLFNQNDLKISFFENVIKEVEIQPEYQSKRLMFVYRFGRYIKYHTTSKVWDEVYKQLNRKIVEEQLNSSFFRSIDIGFGTKIFHPYNIIINNKSKIGKNVTLRGNTTIGNNGDNSLPSPTIGDGVNIGINVNIIGPIEIGKNSKIGAGSIVVKTAPDNSILVGNPAKNIANHIL